MQSKVIVKRQSNFRRRGLNRKAVKQVQKIIDKSYQLKIYYTLSTAITFGANNSSAYLVEITNIPTGDEFNQRFGDDIRVKSIKLHLCFVTQATMTDGLVRVLVLRSKVGAQASSNFPNTPLGQPDGDKFQTYFDKVYAYGNNTAGNGQIQYPATNIELFKSFQNKKVPHLNVGYEGGSTTANMNPIYLYVIGSQGNALNPLFYGWSAIKWFDKN